MSRRGNYIPIGLVAFLILVLAGCTKTSETDQTSSGKNAEAKGNAGLLGRLTESTKPVTVPEGTQINVVLNQTLSSADNRSGDEFDASVSAPVVVDGKTVIPKDARVKGRVVEARPSGRLHGVARLRLALKSVEVGGKSYAIDTTGTARAGGSHKKRNIEMIGGGAGLGAIIGGIAGGGKGALIGGAAGAGAGTATAAITGKKDIRIPAETHLTFRLTQPVTIPVKG